MNNQYQYPGHELEIFEGATNWKNYFRKYISPYIGNHVLEVGAGLGATTNTLYNEKVKTWTLLEPDNLMCEQLSKSTWSNKSNIIIQKGTLDQTDSFYNTILYIDVLEHIENDRLEFQKATTHLAPGGYIVVLAPAFNFLYSSFDKAIAHYRRYSKSSLKSLTIPEVNLVSITYLDMLGFIASLVNKTALHQSYPTKKQIQFWDKKLIPLSQFLDKAFFHLFGKTILAIWQKK